jgi:F-type H+-transporting ATPase subunit gamma
MSSQAELTQRFSRLKEISGIMTAMKGLSLVETRKLARFIGHQRSMKANIEAAAADFLNFFPVAGADETQPAILLLIGSERGFCGNFNERILAAMARLPNGHGKYAAPDNEPRDARFPLSGSPPVGESDLVSLRDDHVKWDRAPALLVLGHRLGTKLESHPGVIERLDGPTVTEDVPAVLNRLMDALHTASKHSGSGAALFCLAHGNEGEDGGEPELKRLLPLALPPAPQRAHPPRLQIAPPEFFAELLDQYLLATLYGLLYESLAAENRQRLAHMEHALDRLDETIAHLALKRNALRQEKIVEEIEIILSSEQAFAEADAAKYPS